MKFEPLTTEQICALVAGIQSGDTASMETLYRIVMRLRYWFGAKIGWDDADDLLHEAYVDAVRQIRRGDLNEPERFMGYLRSITSRKMLACIQERVEERDGMRKRELFGEVQLYQHATPQDIEAEALEHEQRRIALAALAKLRKVDREILTRAYLDGETKDQTCERMSLTETQYRLLKSRALARIVAMVHPGRSRQHGQGRGRIARLYRVGNREMPLRAWARETGISHGWLCKCSHRMSAKRFAAYLEARMSEKAAQRAAA